MPKFTIRYIFTDGTKGRVVSGFDDIKSAVDDFLKLAKEAGQTVKGLRVYAYRAGDESRDG